jgi:hypothetical protein
MWSPMISTSPDNVKHIKGRTYEVKVDKGHYPAQIPRGTIAMSYVGPDGENEVTAENVGEFNVMFVRDDLRARLEALMANGHPDGSDLTLNEALERVIVYLEQEDEVGQDPDRTSWRPEWRKALANA